MELLDTYLNLHCYSFEPGRKYRFSYDYSGSGNVRSIMRVYEGTYLNSFTHPIDGLTHCFNNVKLSNMQKSSDSQGVDHFSHSRMLSIEPFYKPWAAGDQVSFLTHSLGEIKARVSHVTSTGIYLKPDSQYPRSTGGYFSFDVANLMTRL